MNITFQELHLSDPVNFQSWKLNKITALHDVTNSVVRLKSAFVWEHLHKGVCYTLQMTPACIHPVGSWLLTIYQPNTSCGSYIAPISLSFPLALWCRQIEDLVGLDLTSLTSVDSVPDLKNNSPWLFTHISLHFSLLAHLFLLKY